MNKTNLNRIFKPVLLLITMIIIGIIGYMILEDFDFIEAFYLTIITISTVGFGTVHQFSSEGMLFASFLIIFSFGIFAYTVTTFTHLAVDGVFKNYFLNRQVKKRIKKLENHVIVCGYGRNGKQATIELADHNIDCIIIDMSQEIIEEIKDNTDLLFIQGDASHDDILEEAQIKRAKALITALPNDSDNLFIVLSAKELNPNIKIISRASEEKADKKLKRAGADNVIMPDKIGGARMAKLVAQPDIVEFVENIMIQSHNDVSLEEIFCTNMKAEFVNKSIGELGIRNKSGANIIGLRGGENDEYIFNPSPEIKLQKNYKLFVLGSPSQIKKFTEVLIG